MRQGTSGRIGTVGGEIELVKRRRMRTCPVRRGERNVLVWKRQLLLAG